ncbi:hypothetical protein [Acidisoma sp. 7E03]
MSGGISTVTAGSVTSNFTSSAYLPQFYASITPNTVITNIYGSGSYSIGGGTDYPQLVAITPNAAAVSVDGASIIAVGGADDSVTATGTTPIVAFLGSGTLFTDENSVSTIYGGTGAATVTAGSAATTLFGGSGDITFSAGSSSGDFVLGGSGQTNIAGGAGGNNTLIGGSGTTLITATGSSTGDLLVGGVGTTVINASSTTGALTISVNPNSNSGTLVATLGSGADTALAGAGNAVIQGGSGPDVYGFVAGHSGGAVTILGFSGKDNIAFEGYSGPPVESVGSLGDVITLSDGTTITLSGIDHKIFST